MEPHAALKFLSPLYGAAISLRERLYRSGALRPWRAEVPVICVGNAIAGGSGKSPFVQYLATSLASRGRRPVILLRGYGGRLRGPSLVTPHTIPLDAGDEAVMHRSALEEVPVIVARRRVDGSRLAADHGDVVVMDDGYQHLALERDVNLLLLDISSDEAIDRWGSGSLLPGGWLREPLTSALARASAVVLMDRAGRAQAAERARRIVARLRGNLPIATFYLAPTGVRMLNGGPIAAADELRGLSVRVCSALGSPGPFEALVRSLGVDVTEVLRYPDHHSYSASDVEQITAGAPIVVTTAKDAAKLRALVSPDRDVRVLLVGATPLTSDDEQIVQGVIEQALSRV